MNNCYEAPMACRAKRGIYLPLKTTPVIPSLALKAQPEMPARDLVLRGSEERTVDGRRRKGLRSEEGRKT